MGRPRTGQKVVKSVRVSSQLKNLDLTRIIKTIEDDYNTLRDVDYFLNSNDKETQDMGGIMEEKVMSRLGYNLYKIVMDCVSDKKWVFVIHKYTLFVLCVFSDIMGENRGFPPFLHSIIGRNPFPSNFDLVLFDCGDMRVICIGETRKLPIGQD